MRVVLTRIPRRSHTGQPGSTKGTVLCAQAQPVRQAQACSTDRVSSSRGSQTATSQVHTQPIREHGCTLLCYPSSPAEAEGRLGQRGSGRRAREVPPKGMLWRCWVSETHEFVLDIRETGRIIMITLVYNHIFKLKKYIYIFNIAAIDYFSGLGVELKASH